MIFLVTKKEELHTQITSYFEVSILHEWATESIAQKNTEMTGGDSKKCKAVGLGSHAPFL